MAKINIPKRECKSISISEEERKRNIDMIKEYKASSGRTLSCIATEVGISSEVLSHVISGRVGKNGKFSSKSWAYMERLLEICYINDGKSCMVDGDYELDYMPIDYNYEAY